MPEERSREPGSPGALVWRVGAVAVLGSLLAQMDATVVNVSLSSLATSLHSTLSTIQWVISGYLLALALMLPLNAWLVRRIGAKALYLWCFASFTLFSMLCGFAWSARSLIGFRVVQGMSGGLMAPLAQMMMARVAGKNIARVFGYVAVPVLLGPILGPILAGVILQCASWRWLFFINLPLGVLGLVLALLFLPGEREPMPARPFDVCGFLLLSPGLVLFLFGLEHGTESLGRTALLLATGLLAAFLGWSLRSGGDAIVDLRLFRGRIFAVAAVAQFLTNGLMFAGQMLIPVYLMRACGKTPAEMGWLLAPLGLGMVCTYPWMGALTERFGIRRVAAGGALLALAGTAPFLYLAGHGLSIMLLACALFLRGAGLSAVGVPSVAGAYASVPREELPMATTSLNIVQRLGGPAITTMCATFLGWKLAASSSTAASASAFFAAFLLLCGLHALLVLAAAGLPWHGKGASR